MDDHEKTRDSVLQERVNLLKDQGYRGFQLKKSHLKNEEAFEVQAVNEKGIHLLTDGNTLDEACESLIERIDYTLDDL